MRESKFFIITVVLLLLVPAAESRASNIDIMSEGSKYSWGETVGWFNWNPEHSGVVVSTGYLSGYVWHENIGWIHLGDTPDNGISYANDSETDYGVNRNQDTGELSGYGWGEKVGWINFNPTHGGVTVTEEGFFSGYAWGENIRWVHFSTDSHNIVRTSAMPAPPTDVQGTVLGISSITWTWSDNSSGWSQEDGFQIYNATSSELIGTVGQDVTSFTWTGLEPATDYQIYLRPYNTAWATAESDSAPSDIIATAEILSDTPLYPSFSNVTPSSFEVNWTDIPGASYNAVLSDTADFSVIISSEVLTESSAVYSGLSWGATYYFRVKLLIEPESAYTDPAISARTLSLVEATFDPVSNGGIHAIAVQPDGKILLGGSFTTIGAATRNRIARLNADGTIDETFNPNLVGIQVSAISLQSDGKILLGGDFTAIGGVERNRIARLNADGTVDETFNPNVEGGDVLSASLQSDGKVLLGGNFTIGGVERNRIARLNADGTVDETFNPNAEDGVVLSVSVQSDGKILLGGFFTTIGGQARNRIARLNSDGTLDTDFNPSADSMVRSVSVQSDGKILLGGDFTTIGGVERNRIARLNADGTVDETFNPNAEGGVVLSVSVQSDGKILLGGFFTTIGGQARNRIARLNSDGTLDTEFNPNADASVTSISIQSDGKILLGGGFTTIGGETRIYLARIEADSPAVETLSVLDNFTRLDWQRSGSSAEVYLVKFYSSTDAVNWTFIGDASRVLGGWVLTGVSLPYGEGYVKVEGRTGGGYRNASESLIESVIDYYKPLPPAPHAPVITSDSEAISSSQIKWVWSDVENEDGYRVLSSTLGVLADLPADTTTWTNLSPLTPNTSQFICVEAYNVSGSSMSEASPVIYTLANPPSSLGLDEVNISSVTLSWGVNNNPQGTRYGLSYSNDADFSVNVSTPIDIASAHTSETAYISGLLADTTYYFRVWAYNQDDIVTEFSDALSVMTLSEPPSFNFVIETTVGMETFAFRVDDASGFEIDWGMGSGFVSKADGSYTYSKQYEEAGEYIVRVRGEAERISFYGDVFEADGTPDLLKDILTPVYPGVSGITSAHDMFAGAVNISSFTAEDFFDAVILSVTNLNSMFAGAANFNHPIGHWDTSNVISFNGLFEGASSFNQSLENWVLSSAEEMAFTFFNATAFNQDISNWDISKVSDFTGFLSNSGLSVENYNKLLNSWAGRVTISSIQFGAAGLNYSGEGIEGRESLITQYDWSFIGDNYFAQPVPGLAELSAVPGDIEGGIELLWTLPDINDAYSDPPFNYKVKIQVATDSMASSEGGWHYDNAQITEFLTGEPGDAATISAQDFTAEVEYFFRIWHGYDTGTSEYWSDASDITSSFAKSNSGVLVERTNFHNLTGFTPNRNIVRDSVGNLYAAFVNDENEYNQVGIKVSQDEGISWEGYLVTSNSPGLIQQNPSISIDGDNRVHLIWTGESSQSGLQEYIRYLNYDHTDGLSELEEVYFAGAGNEIISKASVIDSDGTIHIVWINTSESIYEINYSYRDPSLGEWSSLWNVGVYDYFLDTIPEISLTSGKDNELHLIYNTFSQGSYKIVYGIKNPGAPWELSDINAKEYPMSEPQIVSDSDGRFHAFWINHSGDIDKIYHTFYNSSDSTWVPETTVRFNTDYSQGNYSVAAGLEGKLYIVWTESDNNSINQIYYAERLSNAWTNYRQITYGANAQSYPSLRWSPWFNNEGYLDLLWTSKQSDSTYEVRFLSDPAISMAPGFEWLDDEPSYELNIWIDNIPEGYVQIEDLPYIYGGYDSSEGLSRVYVRVLRLSDQLEWDYDSGEWLTETNWIEADIEDASSWYFYSVPEWVSGSSYAVIVQAIDVSGNGSAEFYAEFEYYEEVELSDPYFEIIGETIVTAGETYSYTVNFIGPYGEIDEYFEGEVSLISDEDVILPSELMLSSGSGTFEVIFPDTGEEYVTFLEASHYMGGLLVGFGGIEVDPNLITGRLEPITVSPADSISGRVTQKNDTPITGVIVDVFSGGIWRAQGLTDTAGNYRISGLLPGNYKVRASWEAGGIISSVEGPASNGTAGFNFTLEVSYQLGEIVGSLDIAGSGVSSSEIFRAQSQLASGEAASDTAYIELSQRGSVRARVPVLSNGNFSIPNLLPGNYTARAYNGAAWSGPVSFSLGEGQIEHISFSFPVNIQGFYTYPNPSSLAPSEDITIRYETAAKHTGSIRIYTLSGELVREFSIDEPAGVNSVSWDKKNSSGRDVASGVYFVILRTENSTRDEEKVKRIRTAVIR